MTSGRAAPTQAATQVLTRLSEAFWSTRTNRALSAAQEPRRRRRRRPGTGQPLWPPEQLLPPVPARCSLSAFRSASLCRHSGQAPPLALLLPSSSSSCPLLLEASPPSTPNLRRIREACVALRCSGLAEHPDPPGTRGGAAPAWTSPVRGSLQGRQARPSSPQRTSLT